MEMSELLRKKPNPNGKFAWMVEWQNIKTTAIDTEAFVLFKNGCKDYCNLENIKTPVNLLAFLRYDYKKVLVRTRYIYIDRLRWNQHQIAGTDLDMAFFEPIFLCFPVLELMGRFLFSKEVSWTVPNPKTHEILQPVLSQMGNGYQKYAKELVSFHRHALAHELRPDKNWIYDLNTEDRYGSPHRTSDGMIYLNIPHFIDSSLLQVEKTCEQLESSESENVMNKFFKYISIRFPSLITHKTQS